MSLKQQGKNRRGNRGRWAPGASGNPAGRPPGAGLAGQLRALLEPHAPDLVAKAVELAKAGDTTALRICLERCVPALKPVDVPVSLPDLAGGDLSVRAGAVLAALGKGEIGPEQAASAIRTLAVFGEITVLADLEARIAKLESAKGGPR